MSIIKRSIYKALLLSVLVLINTSSFSKTIFVSLRGSDDYGNGSINMPYQTLPKAINLSTPGSSIYIRGGVYNYTSTVKLNKSGTSNNYITIAPYNNETVILDFSQETYSASMRGLEIDKGFGYWYIKNLVIKSAGDNGIYISGNNNIIENCQVSLCRDAGIQISSGGSYNYLHNCDSYSNYDFLTDGGNADGFSVKLDPGPGNVLRGCRSWNNSDDGYDLYENAYKVVFDSCWAWHNGYAYANGSIISTSSMNGNGFKVGGNYFVGHHRLTNCVAFGNKSKGFDQNNNNGGVTVINCTGYNNGYYNFSFPNDTVYLRGSNGDTIQTYIKDGVDTMINNISYKSPGARFAKHHNVQLNNSWNLQGVSSSDFISLDTALAATLRLPDGSLPVTSLFRLNTGSVCIDAGIPEGIVYNGSAPDLGAFETNSENTSTQSIVLNATINNKTILLNWAVTNELSNTGWVLQRVSVYNYSANAVWDNISTTISLGAANNSLHVYDTIDNLHEYGAYVYRIKQTDLSGVIRYSNVVKINTINNTIPFSTTVSVYPSPFKDVFNINFIIPSPKVIQIALLNSKGQFVTNIVNHYYNTRGSIFVPYNGSSLASGVYYLKFIADDGSNSTIPILKMP